MALYNPYSASGGMGGGTATKRAPGVKKASTASTSTGYSGGRFGPNSLGTKQFQDLAKIAQQNVAKPKISTGPSATAAPAPSTSRSGTATYTQAASAPANTGPSQAELEAQAKAKREAEARAEYDRIEGQRKAELEKALANIPTLEAWLGMDQQYVGDVQGAKTGWGNNMTGWRNNLSQQTSAADFKTALDQLGWRGATVNDYMLNDFQGDAAQGQKVTGGLSGGEVSGGAWDKDYTYGAYGSGYQSLMNDAAARGMLNSTGYADNMANFNTDMNNQYNSLLDARGQTATNIGNTASSGYGDYMSGLARLLQDSTERGATKYGVNGLKKNGAGAYTAQDFVDPFQYQTQAYQGPIYW